MSICNDQSNKTIAILISYKTKYRIVIGWASCLFIFYTHHITPHTSCHSIPYHTPYACNTHTEEPAHKEVEWERERMNERATGESHAMDMINKGKHRKRLLTMCGSGCGFITHARGREVGNVSTLMLFHLCVWLCTYKVQYTIHYLLSTFDHCRSFIGNFFKFRGFIFILHENSTIIEFKTSLFFAKF